MTTSNAEQLGELLSAYLDGELDERDSQRAAAILRQDPQARQLYADLKRTRELVHALPRHAAPTSIATDVLARLERSALLPEPDSKTVIRRKPRSWWKAPLSMAAVLGLCATGWWAISRNGDGLLDGFSRGTQLTDSAPPAKSELAAKAAADVQTVEAKLAAGVAPAALQQHPFDNEPVRLALVVDSERERDEVLRRLSRRFDAAKVPDLASDVRQSAAGAPLSRDATFFYQGQPGVNFADAASQQLLVRASPSQVQSVLKEVERVARRDDQLALQAGPLQMQGRKGIDALQLFSDAASVGNGADGEGLRDASASRAEPAAAGQKAPAAVAAESESAETALKPPDEEAARFVQELLAAAGLESKKAAPAEMAPEKLPAAEAAPSTRRSRSRESDTVASAPPLTQPNMERSASPSETPSPKERAVPAAAANTESAISIRTQPQPDHQNHLTFILELRTKPKSPTPTTRLRAIAPRSNTRGNSDTRSHQNYIPS